MKAHEVPRKDYLSFCNHLEIIVRNPLVQIGTSVCQPSYWHSPLPPISPLPAGWHSMRFTVVMVWISFHHPMHSGVKTIYSLELQLCHNGKTHKRNFCIHQKRPIPFGNIITLQDLDSLTARFIELLPSCPSAHKSVLKESVPHRQIQIVSLFYWSVILDGWDKHTNVTLHVNGQ